MPRKSKKLPVPSHDVEQGGVSKLTPETVSAIENALMMGSYVEVAYLFAGIKPRTAEYWMQLGRTNPGGKYGDFLERIKVALAKSEFRDLAVIDMFAQGRAAVYQMVPMVDGQGMVIRDEQGKMMMKPFVDGNGNPVLLKSEVRASWQAAAWKLERRAPKRWGRTDRILIDDMTRIADPVSEDGKPKDVNSDRVTKITALIKSLSEIEDMDEI